MNQLKKLRNLNNLSYFDKNTLSQFVDISDNSLYTNIKRWLKNGDLIQLKRGLYVTKEYFSTLTNKPAYTEFIANKLKEPSYLSLEYVLQKYSILTEAVYSCTSITLKTKRSYDNKLGSFIYRNIKDDLFTGYDIVEKDEFRIREASKAKALFDYLYLKTLRVKTIERELFDSYRLNLDDFSREDLKEFSEYCKIAGTGKLLKLLKLVDLSGEVCDS